MISRWVLPCFILFVFLRRRLRVFVWDVFCFFFLSFIGFSSYLYLNSVSSLKDVTSKRRHWRAFFEMVEKWSGFVLWDVRFVLAVLICFFFYKSELGTFSEIIRPFSGTLCDAWLQTGGLGPWKRPRGNPLYLSHPPCYAVRPGGNSCIHQMHCVWTKSKSPQAGSYLIIVHDHEHLLNL